MADPIIIVDMREREEAALKKLDTQIYELEQIEEGKLSPQQKKHLFDLIRLKWLSDNLSAKQKSFFNKMSPARLGGVNRKPILNADPLYARLDKALKEMCGEKKKVGAHDKGILPTVTDDDGNIDLTLEAKRLVIIYGILELDTADPGSILELATDAGTDGTLADRRLHGFDQAVANGLGEYTANKKMFEGVWDVFWGDGDIHAKDQYRASHFVSVVRTLVAQGITHDNPLLPLRVRAILSSVSGSGGPPPGGAPLLSSVIDLPDLEEQADTSIQVENLHAMQAIYFCAMLEELKVFQVVDKLVEQAHYGLLPVSKGNAAHLLYEYWKKGQDRLTELERRNLYARTLGLVGGDASQQNINRNFDNLWMRFISAVSTFYRQLKVDQMFRMAAPLHLHQEQVRKAGRDLAGNLSLYGFGVTFYAAAELQDQINEIIKILSEPDIRSAYGARDMYQLIDQVASLELGGAKNSIRYRTMAQSGATIIRWLSMKAQYLSGYSTSDVINTDQIYGRQSSGDRPMANPSDYDLVNAVEQWLAVNGIPTQQVEEYSQPYEPPPTTTRPIHVPAAARDILESYGIQAGTGRSSGYSPYGLS